MKYTLKLHRDVEKQLARIPSKQRERVIETMRSLRNDPRPSGCIKLSDVLYRVREGQYRIIYAIFDDEVVVFICKVARRTETTYRDLQKLLATASAEKKFKALPRFPATLRDIAIILDVETPSQKVMDIIRKSPLTARVALFDVYTGKQVPQGKKSLALSISYQSPDRTLTDEEVDKAQGKILERLTKELGVTLRG